MLKSLAFPSEVVSMLRLKFGGHIKKTHSDQTLDDLGKSLSGIDFCYEVLNRVSRSFAVVIQQLPDGLKDATCVFYLVLRGLDSVEDDMTYDVKSKIPLLKVFYQKLEIDGWSIEGVGDSADYRTLLKHFGKVIQVYKSLDKQYRDAISNITKLMGAGMAEYADKPGSLKTTKEYDQYCHYVAGLVGYGLSDLFSASGLEDADLKDMKKVSNSMGCFLQKTNIIRDYLEDLDDGRTWWPEDVWSQYASELSFFKHNPKDAKSLECLNFMVQEALALVPDVLTYLRKLKHPKIFAFCAIPQIMAIATLEKVYNNVKVFQGNVKVRKGLSCKMMLNCNTMDDVNAWFNQFASKLEMRSRNVVGTVNVSVVNEGAKKIMEMTSAAPWAPYASYEMLRQLHWFALSVLFYVAVNSCSIFSCCDGTESSENASSGCCTTMYAWSAAAVISLLYVFGVFKRSAF